MKPYSSWLPILIMQVIVVGCSTPVASGALQDAADKDEFWRTTYCVSGGLSMEVRFSLADNPAKLRGESLDFIGVDRIKEQVDTRIASLLREAAAAAWIQAHDNYAAEWSNPFISELAEILVLEVSDRAPKALGISFCGNPEQVGNAVYAALFEYFNRAVRLEDGSWPDWLSDARARSHGGIIVMLAVALRLAQIEFDPLALVQTFEE